MRKYPLRTALNLLITLLVFSSCTVTILAPYDEVTDQKTAELQELIIYKLNEWESIARINPDSSVLSYNANLNFYNKSQTIVQILQSRNEGIEKNKVVNGQLDVLAKNLVELKEIHIEDVFIKTADLELMKNNFNVLLGAVQKFQQTRKASRMKQK